MNNEKLIEEIDKANHKLTQRIEELENYLDNLEKKVNQILAFIPNKYKKFCPKEGEEFFFKAGPFKNEIPKVCNPPFHYEMEIPSDIKEFVKAKERMSEYALEKYKIKQTTYELYDRDQEGNQYKVKETLDIDEAVKWIEDGGYYYGLYNSGKLIKFSQDEKEREAWSQENEQNYSTCLPKRMKKNVYKKIIPDDVYNKIKAGSSPGLTVLPDSNQNGKD